MINIKRFSMIFIIIISFISLLILKKHFKEKMPHVKSLEHFSYDRWDIKQVISDCEKSEAIKNFGSRLCQMESKPCFSWVLEESPNILCLLAIIAEDEVHNASDSEIAHEFWKFMYEPGKEVVLTEAAYREYLPAMSLLASLYQNAGRSEEAEYWRKVGAAYANPTTMLLRGLEFMIDGKQNQNEILTKKGQELIIFSLLQGENKAIEVPGFEKISLQDEFQSLNQAEMQDIICEIEDNDKSRALGLLEEIESALGDDKILISLLISLVQRVNDILDDPNVTVSEIRHLLPFRNLLVAEVIAGLESTQDNETALKSFIKAEMFWKHQRVSGGKIIIEKVLLPAIFGN